MSECTLSPNSTRSHILGTGIDPKCSLVAEIAVAAVEGALDMDEGFLVLFFRPIGSPRFLLIRRGPRSASYSAHTKDESTTREMLISHVGDQLMTIPNL